MSKRPNFHDKNQAEDSSVEEVPSEDNFENDVQDSIVEDIESFEDEFDDDVIETKVNIDKAKGIKKDYIQASNTNVIKSSVIDSFKNAANNSIMESIQEDLIKPKRKQIIDGKYVLKMSNTSMNDPKYRNKQMSSSNIGLDSNYILSGSMMSKNNTNFLKSSRMEIPTLLGITSEHSFKYNPNKKATQKNHIKESIAQESDSWNFVEPKKPQRNTKNTKNIKKTNIKNSVMQESDSQNFLESKKKPENVNNSIYLLGLKKTVGTYSDGSQGKKISITDPKHPAFGDKKSIKFDSHGNLIEHNSSSFGNNQLTNYSTFTINSSAIGTFSKDENVPGLKSGSGLQIRRAKNKNRKVLDPNLQAVKQILQ